MLILQSCADGFEKAWQSAVTADLAQHLPEPGHPLRRLILQELIKTVMEIRWRRGHLQAGT
jgi:hypothetical protein